LLDASIWLARTLFLDLKEPPYLAQNESGLPQSLVFGFVKAAPRGRPASGEGDSAATAAIAACSSAGAPEALVGGAA
jgi:hypothetical protein